jgi:CBS domain containing-hemolysin-like protein
VFFAITYLSLIIGELVPKNLALRNAESIACTIAPLMMTLSRIAVPAVWLLDVSVQTTRGTRLSRLLELALRSSDTPVIPLLLHHQGRRRKEGGGGRTRRKRIFLIG